LILPSQDSRDSSRDSRDSREVLPASRRSFGLPSKIEKGASIKLDADGKPQIAGMAPDLLAAYQKELALVCRSKTALRIYQ
jgi:hypothetical protein